MKRKLHRMNLTSERSADDSAMASSSTPSPVSQWKPIIPSDGWGLSLEKVPLFTRAEMDRHIGMSGKHIGGNKHAHHSVPTGFKKAKTYLEEYLHATYLHTYLHTYSSTFTIVPNVFLVLKGTKAPTI